MTLPLPDIVAPEEILGRIICAGSSKKNYKSKIKQNTDGIWEAQVSLFIDTTNPMAISVNRVSTLPLAERHKLGLTHQQEHQADQTYHGLAEIIAQWCFELDSWVEKDDEQGEKPYHANILYPTAQTKEKDSHGIATVLAFKAVVQKFP